MVVARANIGIKVANEVRDKEEGKDGNGRRYTAGRSH